MIRDQLLTELWAAYPNVIFDVVEVNPLEIVTRGPWKDDKDIVGKHVPNPDWDRQPDPGVPADIPIREGLNTYYIRVVDGQLKLYDVDDALVKKWWEVWKR